MGFDDRGKVKLSMRVVDQQTGADLEKAEAPRPRRRVDDRSICRNSASGAAPAPLFSSSAAPVP